MIYYTHTLAIADAIADATGVGWSCTRDAALALTIQTRRQQSSGAERLLPHGEELFIMKGNMLF